jgi:hypothetical protein
MTSIVCPLVTTELNLFRWNGERDGVEGSSLMRGLRPNEV